jgi:PAS domain S-box-containing protein
MTEPKPTPSELSSSLALPARQPPHLGQGETLAFAGKALRESEDRLHLILDNVPVFISYVDATLRYRSVNRAYEEFFKLSRETIIGSHVSEVLGTAYFEAFRERMGAALAGERVSFETPYKREGRTHQLSVDYVPNVDRAGTIQGLYVVVQDTTARRQADDLMAVRLRLLDFAAEHSLDELLVRTLDEAELLSGSLVGFYHFVDADQRTLSLKAWSTGTVEKFCKAEGEGQHYSLDLAGVWADCVRLRRPIVHNDYATLSDKKGLPEGHASVIRELVVPILREGSVVAVLGVGNKPTPYTDDDVRSVTYLADVAWEICRHKRAEEGLRESEERYRTILQTAMDGFALTDLDGRILEVNATYCRMTGYSAQELLAMRISDLDTSESTEETQARIRKIATTGEDRFESVHRRKDGTVLEVEVSVQRRAADGDRLVSFIRDISERKRASEEKAILADQLLQAQKMESVGRLAGGVAHDFNNMLCIIRNNAEFALQQVDPTSTAHADLQEILTASNRSADLTRQLLAFARKQTVSPKVLDLNHTVEGMLKMLGRLIGEDLTLVWQPGADLWPVMMDPAQIDQMLANLCVNARDAIADIGKITISTGMKTITVDDLARHVGLVAGDYVWFAVSDDGCGMDEATMSQIFEPFFTTKDVGKGTGLGLATVYGIVKQNCGFIDLESEPGKGSTFTIFLPRHVGKTSPVPVEHAAQTTPRDRSTILLVEDEPAILKLTTRMLEKFGYYVLPASTPGEAMRLAREHQGEIHLLVTDVVMPEMNGRDLAKNVLSLYPEIKRLFMSGYTAEVIAHQGILEDGVAFIQKPFSMDEMLSKVGQVLDSCSKLSIEA